jgi:hypothetical protein
MRFGTVLRRHATGASCLRADCAVPRFTNANASDRSCRLRGPNFMVLWMIVSGLWTSATILRIDRVSAPGHGWPEILGNPFTWVSLFIPPLMYAIILLGVKRMATTRQPPNG